jgi:glucans biosynthesis protein
MKGGRDRQFDHARGVLNHKLTRKLPMVPLLKRTLALTALWITTVHGAPAVAFDFADVAVRAEALSRQPYRDLSPKLPAELAALTYDQTRDIRFRPARALWRADQLPFELMFFHVGGKYHVRSVRVNEVTPSGVRHIAYDSADFDYGKDKLSPQTWGDVGFAGLRAHYPLNGSEYKDELVVFQGASYFRALGAGQRYGLSARGLAIDTVGGQGEEFPWFIEFWVVRPAADAKTLTLYGLLDSPRGSGAYQFDVRPGEETVVDVRARLFLRAVLLRREPAASHRLSSGSARLGRHDGGDRRRRVDLASARQSESDADDVVLDALAQGFRPDAAGPELQRLRRQRSAL